MLEGSFYKLLLNHKESKHEPQKQGNQNDHAYLSQVFHRLGTGSDWTGFGRFDNFTVL